RRADRRGPFGVGDRLEALDAFYSGESDDVACRNNFRFVALETAKSEKLGNPRWLQRTIQLGDTHCVTVVKRAAEDARDGDAAEVIAVVEIRHLHLHDARGAARRRRHGAHYGFKERIEIGGVVSTRTVPDAVRYASLGVGVENWKIELRLGSVEIDEKIVNFIEYFGGPRVGAIDFI